MKKLTFNINLNLVTPADIWAPVKGLFIRSKSAVSKFFREIRTSIRRRKNERHIIECWAHYGEFPEHRSFVQKESIEVVKSLVSDPKYSEELHTWILDEAFKFFENNPKERESIAVLFNVYFGQDRSSSPTARIVAENIFTQELGRRSWGRSIEIRKGKNHYMLVYITTPNGEFKFNLGRYPEDTIPDIGKEGILIVGEPVV